MPEKVELAVIATPAAAVPGLVRECVAQGVTAAIIISAGFAELGAEGRKLEEEIRGIAHGKLRIVGPNCLGIIHPPSNLNASFAASMAAPGQVALLSQSGAICTAILDWARQAHVGLSSFVSVGSMLDVDFADLIDFFADDAATRSIVLYMESIGDVRKFLSAARSASRAKHVIVVKAGRHEAGARAAASHTGALAGADAVFDAAFRRAGVLRVETIPDLFDMSEILAMQPLMERTKIYEAFQGVRGQKGVNLEALETLLVRFSLLLVDFPEIQEIDLNPVLATPDRMVSLDARLLLAPAEQPPEQRPRLAIHPYPNQYIAPFRLRDGREVLVRPIRPEDEPLIVALHAGHSEHTIRMRFFSMVKTLSRDSPIRLCHLDYDREMALTAVMQENNQPHLLGVARYYLQLETGAAEFALVVSDAYQRQGLGRHLMQRLIAIARERGVQRLAGQVLAEDAPMLHLMRALGFAPPIPVEDQVVRVELSLAETMGGRRTAGVSQLVQAPPVG